MVYFSHMKNNRNQQFKSLSHAEEYGIIRQDLYKVLALNSVYLGVLLALYFVNKNTHVLDKFFAKLLHF
jgi:hypothetical protein